MKMSAKKCSTSILLNDEKVDAFILDGGKRQTCLLLPLIVIIVLEIVAGAIIQEKAKKKKKYIDWKDRNNTCSQAAMKNPKELTKKIIPALISDYSKATRYNANISKSVNFCLYQQLTNGIWITQLKYNAIYISTKTGNSRVYIK